ncbi:MAG: glutathione S-transferase N-terminal domain-containing protein [Zoogloeaceae bacterium]|jgi:glutathione S-transferase|nr:glutathione S-transferase N-terminal domain-containing protein [Zoogloeaceae bacterium]
MKLYYCPGACSFAAQIALQEAGLPYEAERVDLNSGKLADGTDFRSINPLGYVPLLALGDGNFLLEDSAILLYVADLVPSLRLAPANGEFARYKLLERLNFIATELHKRFTPFFSNAPEAVQAANRAQLAALLAWLDGQLVDRDYQFGATFGVADAYLHAILNWTPYAHIPLDGLDRLLAFQKRVAARPAVQKALALEGR